ncbi:conserved hypothetical protein [Leishmania braziliensis MHOM/BR/75/M2904]|uniref:Complex 1 LYR protein domain-containing protein n=2 Tax=Leishmania braziliensis TaxID=5660 RepID=A4H9N0_LEIBR|nr:conserved hypothetical protein [Leishmania braziliensis MHOM/BR/75/M2904]CAJ2470438.1 unnamed protein product [Leishmania braziliensis]CAM38104.2 conserved hypothetical protein [Leishmania braziliensis MHOM/BR/75/M2904]
MIALCTRTSERACIHDVPLLFPSRCRGVLRSHLDSRSAVNAKYARDGTRRCPGTASMSVCGSLSFIAVVRTLLTSYQPTLFLTFLASRCPSLYLQSSENKKTSEGTFRKAHVIMRACLHLTRVTRHKRHDKGGNAHNFPFDTLTKVYRDTMYVPQERYRGNPMHPERGAEALLSPVVPSRRSNVTNHVGNIGVMSSAATKLSEWMEQQQQQHLEKEHINDYGGIGHESATASCATPIVRCRAAPSSPPLVSSSAAVATEESHVDDEAIRRRLRTHLFSAKKPSERQATAGKPPTASPATTETCAASPRRSGVQVEILSVYRSMLREVSRIQDADTRRNLSAYIREEYDKQRDIPRKNIMKIEWKLNYSKRKLDELRAMGKDTKFTMMR